MKYDKELDEMINEVTDAIIEQNDRLESHLTDRIEELEDEIRFLKEVINSIS